MLLNQKQGMVSQLILKLVSTGENSFTRNALDAELSRIMKVVRDLPEGKQSIRLITKERKKPEQYDASKLPEVLKKTHNEILQLYAANKKMRGALQHIYFDIGGNLRSRVTKSNEEDASAFAMAIVENDKQIANHYRDIDYYLTTGKLRDQRHEQQEIDRLREWLRDYPTLLNYVRKCDTFLRKTGRYQNKEKYDKASETLRQIEEYLEKL